MDEEILLAAHSRVHDLSPEQLAALFEGTWKWGIGGLAAPAGPGWLVRPTVVSDGPAGLRQEQGSRTVPSLLFPSAKAMACTWDPDLERSLGAYVGRLAREQGVDVVLAPGVNVIRHPRVGRSFEYFSEEPLLSGAMGSAYVSGIQSQGVGACLKHFLCNSQETARFSIDARPDETTLMDIYFPAFETVIKTADPWCVMTAYNRFLGTHCDASDEIFYLLRTRLEYRGVVMSDWGAVTDSEAALRAGLDVQMPGQGGPVAAALAPAIREDSRLEVTARSAATRILALNLRAEQAEVRSRGQRAETETSNPALRGAEESIVLLKNVGRVLPLKREQSLCVIGALASAPHVQGYGSSRVVPSMPIITPLQAIQQHFVASYEQGYRLGQAIDPSLEDEAIREAEKMNVCVCFFGVDPAEDAEGLDRETFRLADNQIHLAQRLIESNAKTIFVVQSGCAVDLSPLMGADALIYQPLGGTYAGRAIEEVLRGGVDPSGHLSETMPFERSVPLDWLFPCRTGTETYPERELVGYRWYDTFDQAVAFPFGYGLSYADFEISDLQVTPYSAQTGIQVHFALTNTSTEFDGAQVVQVYLRPEPGLSGRPAHWLAGFLKVRLERGSRRELTLNIPVRRFALWDGVKREYVPVAGNFTVEVGFSSRDICARAQVSLPLTSYTGDFPRGATSRPTLQLPKLPELDAKGEFNLDSSLDEILQSRWLLRQLEKILIRVFEGALKTPEGFVTQQAARLARSNLEYPLRFASVIGLSPKLVQGLLTIANGHSFKGLWRVLTGLVNPQTRAYRRAKRRGL